MQKQAERTKEEQVRSDERPSVLTSMLVPFYKLSTEYKGAQKEVDKNEKIEFWRWEQGGLFYERGRFTEGENKGHEWEKIDVRNRTDKKLTIKLAGDVNMSPLPSMEMEFNQIGLIVKRGKNPQKPDGSPENRWFKAQGYLTDEEVRKLLQDRNYLVAQENGEKVLIMDPKSEDFTAMVATQVIRDEKGGATRELIIRARKIYIKNLTEQEEREHKPNLSLDAWFETEDEFDEDEPDFDNEDEEDDKSW